MGPSLFEQTEIFSLFLGCFPPRQELVDQFLLRVLAVECILVCETVRYNLVDHSFLLVLSVECIFVWKTVRQLLFVQHQLCSS